MVNVQHVESKAIQVQTPGNKRKMHQNGPHVGPLHEEHHTTENLAISVEDVMCGVNLDTKQLTTLNEMTKLM